MSNTRHKHHHERKDTPSKISIFVKNEMNGPPDLRREAHSPAPEITNNVTNGSTSREDGCTSCFKGLFKALRR